MAKRAFIYEAMLQIQILTLFVYINFINISHKLKSSTSNNFDLNSKRLFQFSDQVL